MHFFVRSFRIRLSNTKTKTTTENNVPKPSLFFVFVCFYQECSILCKTEARKLDAAAALADNARRWAADSSRLTVSPLFLLCRLGTHLKKCVHFFVRLPRKSKRPSESGNFGGGEPDFCLCNYFRAAKKISASAEMAARAIFNFVEIPLSDGLQDLAKACGQRETTLPCAKPMRQTKKKRRNGKRSGVLFCVVANAVKIRAVPTPQQAHFDFVGFRFQTAFFLRPTANKAIATADSRPIGGSEPPSFI
ncbi:hypothetical protein ACG2K1_02655 [Neisseria sp. 23W00296]|uniref:hypothetical protein n=1 Tax=unclassified Neisseria TaxID=2623750 RepID=UPI0012EEC17D|nr:MULTISPECIES: hypothetical protein [unclassified Neisseria]